MKPQGDPVCKSSRRLYWGLNGGQSAIALLKRATPCTVELR